MRRKQFVQLISDLRAELGKSVDPAVGVADLPSLKQTIGRVYESLYDSYDWPHLTRFFDKTTLLAGERFYDFPEDTDYDKVERVVIWDNTSPIGIDRGIDFEEYAQFDSNEGVRSDPVMKWDVRDVDGATVLEVWPIPSSNGYSIQFKGKKKFVPLVDDADLCLLDDQLVVLMCAAELLPRSKSADAQLKLAAAQQRLGMTKARSKAGSGSIRMGLGKTPRDVLTRSVVRVSG